MAAFIPEEGASPLITATNGLYVQWLTTQLPKWTKRLEETNAEITRCLATSTRSSSNLVSLFMEAKRLGDRINECHSYEISLPE